ncbi:MAG TPA: SemiSWEET transporter [Cytophagales bacterium]|nr:SemiSWEET transporter [Cytophagales bacterium]
MNGVQIFGFLAGLVTASGMMPQLIKTIKTKKAGELSIQMFLVYVVGFGMWITYGAIREDFPIIVTNSFSLVLTFLMIYFKIKYK